MAHRCSTPESSVPAMTIFTVCNVTIIFAAKPNISHDGSEAFHSP